MKGGYSFSNAVKTKVPYDDGSSIHPHLDLKEFKEMRTRKVKTPAKYRGKRCGAGNGLFDHESRQGECTSRTPACPEEGYCYLSNWGEWSLCKAEDNAKCDKKMGTRNREGLESFRSVVHVNNTIDMWMLMLTEDHSLN